MALAMEQVVRYPMLKPDRDKLRALFTQAVSAPKHFCYVVEDKGRVTGVLAAFIGANLWAQRQHAAITLWVSKTPNGGRGLLKVFKQWVSQRRAIVAAGMTPDLELDSRVLALIERMGFKRRGGSYLLFRSA